MATSNYQLYDANTRGKHERFGICRDCGERSPYLPNAGHVQSWMGDHAEQAHGAEWPEVLSA